MTTEFARPLSAEEYRVRVEPIELKIFVSADPFGEPFSDSLSCKMILYPIPHKFSEEQIEAIGAAARVVGDDGFYFSFTEVPSEWLEEGLGNWFIPLQDLSAYTRLDPAWEHILYSPQGKWGIIVSHEFHAVVGGSARFLGTLTARFPPVQPFQEVHPPLYEVHEPRSPIPAKQQVYEFLRDWKERKEQGAKMPWLLRLLTHVYGSERARRLLQDTGL